MENLICIAVDGRMDKDTLLYKEICGGKWTENYEKKLRDQNAILLLQRRHHMKVNI